MASTALITAIARACECKPKIARWAPFLAASAERLAHPELGLTPLDLALDYAAIIWRETRGENIPGDNGHGRGPGQIDDRTHGDWLKANENGVNPDTSIPFGMQLYVDGLLVIANFCTAHGIQATSGELRRWAMAAYNVGLLKQNGHGVLDQLAAGRDPDEHTTPGLKEYDGPSGEKVARPDYGAATWRMRESFAAALAQPGASCA